MNEDIQSLNPQLTNFLTYLRESIFVKNILVIMSGAAAAQVIGFALTPIISRLYSPSDFGICGSFYSIATTIAAGVTLQYCQALMLPKEKEDAFHLFVVSCICTSIVAVLCLVCCIILPASINGLMKTNGIWALALLVISTATAGINQSCNAWCVRIKAFNRVSESDVVRSLSSHGTQIGLGYYKAGGAGLIVSNLLGNIFQTLNLYRNVFQDMRTLYKNIRLKRMKQLAKDYRDFPMFSASSNIINSLSLGLPVLLLTYFYGVAISGAYAFAMRVLSKPMSFIINSMRPVLFQKAAEVHNDGRRLTPLFVKITLGLFALALIPSLVIFIWAPQLFTWVFGSQWHIAGEFSQSLILWMMFMFCNLPAVIFALIIRIQDKLFVFDLILLSARAIVLFGGGKYLSATRTILLISLLGVIMNIVFIIIVGFNLMRMEGNSELDIVINDLKG